MITGLRSALICSKVEQHPDGRTDYIGVVGAELSAETKPGYLQAWMVLQLELDRKPTSGRVWVECEGLKQGFPFEAPGGLLAAGAAFAMLIPILKEGALWVTIVDDGARGKPLRQKWRLQFKTDAEELTDPNAARQIADTCQRATASAAQGSKRFDATRH